MLLSQKTAPIYTPSTSRWKFQHHYILHNINSLFTCVLQKMQLIWRYLSPCQDSGQLMSYYLFLEMHKHAALNITTKKMHTAKFQRKKKEIQETKGELIAWPVKFSEHIGIPWVLNPKIGQRVKRWEFNIHIGIGDMASWRSTSINFGPSERHPFS